MMKKESGGVNEQKQEKTERRPAYSQGTADAMAKELLDGLGVIAGLFEKIQRHEKIEERTGIAIARHLEAAVEKDQSNDKEYQVMCKEQITWLRSPDIVAALQHTNISQDTAYPEGAFPTCNRCCRTDSMTVRLACNHQVCKQCVNPNADQALLKCPIKNCGHILHEYEVKIVCDFPLKTFDQQKKAGICPLCCKPYQSNSEYVCRCCSYSICKLCFKQYGEYCTNGEVLLGAQDDYKPIPCPFCSEPIEATELLALYPPYMQCLINEHADLT